MGGEHAQDLLNLLSYLRADLQNKQRMVEACREEVEEAQRKLSWALDDAFNLETEIVTTEAELEQILMEGV